MGPLFEYIVCPKDTYVIFYRHSDEGIIYHGRLFRLFKNGKKKDLGRVYIGKIAMEKAHKVIADLLKFDHGEDSSVFVPSTFGGKIPRSSQTKLPVESGEPSSAAGGLLQRIREMNNPLTGREWIEEEGLVELERDPVIVAEEARSSA